MLRILTAGIALLTLAAAQVGEVDAQQCTCETEGWVRTEELEKVKEEMGTQLHGVQNDLDFIMRKVVLEYPEGKKQYDRNIKTWFQDRLQNNSRKVVSKVELLQDSFEDFKEIIVQVIQNISLQERVDCLKERALGTFDNPATSCQQLAESNSTALPGHFWLRTSSTDEAPKFSYCALGDECCSNTQGWMRVAYLNMTDRHHVCPQNFRQITSPKRSCGRKITTGGCNSVTYSVQGREYRSVCGRIIGYQYGSPSGFYTPRYIEKSIDGQYIEGVSVTHGQSPRKHIWSFANALQEATGFGQNQHICPCSNPASTMQQYIPSFVGNDYFCDAGSQGTGRIGQLYTDDPLWDGQGCGLQSTCCSFNNPPWFCKELPQATNDDIEVRICADEEPYRNEDSPIGLIELYVQ